MIKSIVQKITLSLVVMAFLLVPSMRVAAQNVGDVCSGVANAGGSCSDSTGTTVNDVIEVALNIFSGVIGVVAVVMIMIGAFKYITSGGDSSNVKSAKDTILFAIIGLIIVAFAQGIVQFVLGRATG